MISLTIRGDGLVHLHLCLPHQDADEDEYLDALDRIGAIETPFVMVVDISGHRHLSRDGEIRQSAWAKRTRAHISGTCRALALVREKPNPRSQQSFARLWSIPVHVTNDSEDAFAFALAHLTAGKA
ncbi:hypothetical protein [Pararhizobium sp.]|uniref:hypothetical protein n=1 Tax=Pararhizobium sp. TaxID=1977563 RepID=UPI00271AC99A|nr:hypothetical protein [Pararhizobium sp.]MDO9417771.1 hypothetical protein [Pararhizobium sp.]